MEKKIKGFNYTVTNDGKVFSLNYHRMGIKKEIIPFFKNNDKQSYLRIALHKNKQSYKFFVHRLVAETFIPNILNKEQINHINAIKSDNKVNNLEWCSAKENAKHRDDNNLQERLKGSQCSWSKLTEEKVLTIRKQIKKGMSNIGIAPIYNVHRRTISDIRNNKTWRWLR